METFQYGQAAWNVKDIGLLYSVFENLSKKAQEEVLMLLCIWIKKKHGKDILK